MAKFPNVISENDVYLYNAIYYTISLLCVSVNFAKSSQGMPFPNTLPPSLPLLVPIIEICYLPPLKLHTLESSWHTKVCLMLWLFIFFLFFLPQHMIRTTPSHSLSPFKIKKRHFYSLFSKANNMKLNS